MRSNSILKNTGFLLSGSFIQKFISFFTAILITRYLGPEKYGQYTFVISFIAIVAVLWNFGFSTLISRDVSKDKSLTASYQGGIIILKTFLAGIILTLMYFYLRISDYSSIIIISMLIFGVGTYISSISQVFMSIFSAYRRMEYSASLPIIRASILLVAVFIITKFNGGVIEVFSAYFISFIVVLIFAFYFIKVKLVTPTFKLKLSFLMELLKRGFPLVMISVVNIILFRIDVVMLSEMRGDVELGLYGSAYNLFELTVALFPMILLGASFPVLSEQYHKDIEGMKNIFSILLKYFLLVGLPLTLGTILLGDEIIEVLYGEEYLQAGILMSLLGGAIIIFFLSNLVSWTLTAMEKQNFVLYSNMSVMFINIILNFFFIPYFGAKAAAITTLICELIQLTFLSYVFWKLVHIKLRPGLLKILLATLIMGLCIVFLNTFLPIDIFIIKFVILVSISIGVYFLVVFLLKLINKKEFSLLLKN